MFKLTIEVNKNVIRVMDKHKSEAVIQCTNELKDITVNSYGLYGVVDIESCKYLIYITERNKKDDFDDEEVFEICQVGILKLTNSLICHKKQLNNIINFFKRLGIYYSPYPLYKETSLSKSSGDDFIFNFMLLDQMEKVNSNLKNFAVKCIQGYYGAEYCKNLKLYMISRRSWRRSGTRFFSRGSSSDGYVSNYVETELIIHRKNLKMSHIQIRGSIPLSWSHEVMLAYTPKLVIHKENHFKKCHQLLKDRYCEVVYLNLIKNKNYEKQINEKFNKVLQNNNCEYINYDVHGAGSFYNQNTIDTFISNLKKYLDKQGFKTPEQHQTGVIRTNCIDCLDRTNLTQFIISEEIMKRICKYLKIKSDNEIFQLNRKLWLNNGNMLSMQYSGTGALKSHVVSGSSGSCFDDIKDLYKSISRYFINRYFHGSLQDTYDLLTGRNILKKRKKFSKSRLFTFDHFIFLFFLLGLIAVSNFAISSGKFLIFFRGCIFFFLLSLFSLCLMKDYPKFDDMD